MEFKSHRIVLVAGFTIYFVSFRHNKKTQYQKFAGHNQKQKYQQQDNSNILEYNNK